MFLASVSSHILINHFFSDFGQFSKRLSDFKHSQLCQMTTKSLKQPIKIYVYSLAIEEHFIFENPALVLHLILNHTTVLF